MLEVVGIVPKSPSLQFSAGFQEHLAVCVDLFELADQKRTIRYVDMQLGLWNYPVLARKKVETCSRSFQNHELGKERRDCFKTSKQHQTTRGAVPRHGSPELMKSCEIYAPLGNKSFLFWGYGSKPNSIQTGFFCFPKSMPEVFLQFTRSGSSFWWPCGKDHCHCDSHGKGLPKLMWDDFGQTTVPNTVQRTSPEQGGLDKLMFSTFFDPKS